jgi:hypothetical protein
VEEKLIPTDLVCEKKRNKCRRMSANISKWFPKAASQKNSDKVFRRTKSIERELMILANKFTTKIDFNLLDYYVSYYLVKVSWEISENFLPKMLENARKIKIAKILEKLPKNS